MQFKLNPTTLAVRRALAELPYEAKIPNDAPKTERTEAMKAKHRKKHVFWNREHITRLADAMFPKIWLMYAVAGILLYLLYLLLE